MVRVLKVLLCAPGEKLCILPKTIKTTGSFVSYMTETMIMKKLEEIQSDLTYIKSHMRDADMVLTDDDVASLQSAENDLKNGTTVRLV